MIRSVFRSLKLLVVLAVLAVAAFVFREEISNGVTSLLNRGERVEMVAAERERTPEEEALEVEATIQDIVNGRGPEEIRFSEAELQSYVTHRLIVPAGVKDLALDLRDSTAAISASLDFANLPLEPQAVANLRRFMGDSARVFGVVSGRMVGPGDGRLRILSLHAGAVPVPPFLIGLAAAQIGLQSDADGIVIPLVRDITAFRVENEEVIITRDPRERRDPP
ncbi:MAG: hypothetical protein R3266_10305 [Gemmatimonadota bacterium]|nr:hypothetical protein [Gemmatimonadota bacterium]